MNFNAVTRALNTPFQVSGGFNSFVNYSVEVACTLSLSGGQTGTVFLETADDQDFTTNIVEVCRVVNGNTGTLTVGLNITQISTSQLSGMVQAASYVRLRTQSNTGSPTFTYRCGYEADGV